MSLTKEQFKYAYWISTHKKRIKLGIIIGLIILNIFLISLLIFKTTFYFKEQKNYQIMINSLSKNLIDYELFREKNKPKDLVVLLIDSVKSEKQKYDAISQIENLNSQWVAQYDYQFILDGQGGKIRTNFILPNEQKFLMDFNFETLTKNPAVELNITNVQWKRIKNLSKLPKIQFETKNVKYSPMGSQIAPDKKIGVNQVNFEATNNSPYGFWESAFKVILYHDKKIMGINIIPVKQFLSREKKFLSTSWVNFLPPVTKVFIEPEVDVLNSKNLVPVK
ncbi:hypothetical protein HY750_03065 [Candidatus Kuenenbacteria bacterium]|nr:hypothetical protein [Candidatus Kuenenbacteria bacterium]